MTFDPGDLLICAGADGEECGPDNAAAPSIAQTALFHFPDFEALAAGLADEFAHRVYTRGRNPTVELFEKKIAALEHAETAKAFASGMGAASAVMLGLLKRGDRVLFVNRTYGPVLQLAKHLENFGVAHDRALDGDVAAVEQALRPETKLIWLENPGTMTLKLIDVAAIAALGRARDITTIIDNSWATPLFQKPVSMGVDLVLHSCSKYIGGHSDVLGGVLAGRKALIEEIFHKAFMLNGASAAPFEAWLLIRSLRTLPARLRQHEEDALQVAEFLRAHKAVRRVNHPALDEEGAALRRQLGGTTGLFSFELKRTVYDDVVRVLNRLKRFRLGVSWGGVGSLAITPQRRDNTEALKAAGIPAGLIRLSVGLEGAPCLIADLDQALQGL
ncbi:MAG: aminotransferase class I/II-fold pyridoxal phosphate-dependent enzyme [Parvularculaceae bacterium]